MDFQGTPRLEVEDAFYPYVARFEELSEDLGQPTKINNLVIYFGPMDKPNQRALCRTRGNDTPQVIVDRDGWDAMDDAERESLVLHELGHCILRRKHKVGTMQNGVPESLMNPYTMESAVYEQHEEHYKQELFEVKNEF
jgi:hypothetical protein